MLHDMDEARNIEHDRLLAQYYRKIWAASAAREKSRRLERQVDAIKIELTLMDLIENEAQLKSLQKICRRLAK